MAKVCPALLIIDEAHLVLGVLAEDPAAATAAAIDLARAYGCRVIANTGVPRRYGSSDS